MPSLFPRLLTQSSLRDWQGEMTIPGVETPG
jgi:hypothetical protein